MFSQRRWSRPSFFLLPAADHPLAHWEMMGFSFSADYKYIHVSVCPHRYLPHLYYSKQMPALRAEVFFFPFFFYFFFLFDFFQFWRAEGKRVVPVSLSSENLEQVSKVDSIECALHANGNKRFQASWLSFSCILSQATTLNWSKSAHKKIPDTGIFNQC